MNKNTLYTLLLAVAAVVLIIIFFNRLIGGSDSSGTDAPDLSDQAVSTEEPIDIVLDFYVDWLAAVASTSTDPYTAGLNTSELLSAGLRSSLATAPEEGGVDLVLCRTYVPENITAREVFALEDKVQLLVMDKDKEKTEQAVVTLAKLGEGFYIDTIECSLGEFAPEREFTFVRDGQLLKSVPAPLNADFWHIIFTENNIRGNAAPLFFDDNSMCIEANGGEAVCNPDTFTEAAGATVYGEMSEIGVEVKRIEFR